MKKVLVLIAVAAFAMMAQADLITRDWTLVTLGGSFGGAGSEMPSYQTAVLSVPTTSYDGAGWQVDLINLSTASTTASVTANNGWFDGYGYWISGTSFNTLEANSMVLRLWNSTKTYKLDSQVLVLPDLVDPIAIGSTDVTFNFTSSTWQPVIPEPATVGMLGLGALVAMALRRGKRFNRADLA